MALNPQQQLAVDLNDDKILCLAGAGTGKTHSMLARINRIVNEGASTANILVLTFTNAAAFEMRERYKKDHEGKLTPNFCTFHSFCYSLILKDIGVREALGYSKVPHIPDDAVLKSLKITVKQTCNIKLSDDKLDGKKPLNAKEQFEFDVFWKQFNKSMKQSGYITFDSMCYEICELFVTDSPLVQQYKERYKYIFVDEFQDTDPKQYNFVASFKQSKLFVVGDVKQAIYGFRGADSSIIKSLASNDEWTTVKLIHNYRSTKQICDFSNNIGICDRDPAYNIDLESDKDGLADVELHSSVCTEYPNAELKRVLSAVIDSTDENSSLAILTRTNAEVSTIQSILKNMHISFSTHIKSTDTVDILKSVLDEEYMVMWLATKLPANKYAEYIGLCTIDEKYTTFDEFNQLYGNYFAIYKLIDKIKKVKSIINNASSKLYEKYHDCMNVLDIPFALISDTSTDIEHIVNNLIDASIASTSSNLYVGTIHSVKGLEFDKVLLLGVGSNSFRLTTEENRNLYYVGATRAKSELIVYFES